MNVYYKKPSASWLFYYILILCIMYELNFSPLKSWSKNTFLCSFSRLRQQLSRCPCSELEIEIKSFSLHWIAGTVIPMQLPFYIVVIGSKICINIFTALYICKPIYAIPTNRTNLPSRLYRYDYLDYRYKTALLPLTKLKRFFDETITVTVICMCRT